MAAYQDGSVSSVNNFCFVSPILSFVIPVITVSIEFKTFMTKRGGWILVAEQCQFISTDLQYMVVQSQDLTSRVFKSSTFNIPCSIEPPVDFFILKHMYSMGSVDWLGWIVFERTHWAPKHHKETIILLDEPYRNQRNPFQPLEFFTCFNQSRANMVLKIQDYLYIWKHPYVCTKVVALRLGTWVKIFELSVVSNYCLGYYISYTRSPGNENLLRSNRLFFGYSDYGSFLIKQTLAVAL